MVIKIQLGGIVIQIQYRNNKLEKICHDYKKAQKEYNTNVAEKLLALIKLLERVECLNDVYMLRQYNLHPLHGDRKGQYAMDLGRKLGFRLIIIPLNEDGNVWEEKDLQKVYRITTIILVWEVSKHYE